MAILALLCFGAALAAATREAVRRLARMGR